MEPRPAAPRWLWALALLALTAPFWDLGHPLIEVDDARYAEVPRVMALSGDWATPKLNGLDYVEKPPLWYWLCAASYKAFGVSEGAAHLPLALLAILALLGTAWLGSWLYNPAVGLTGAVILGTGGLFIFLSRYITPDLPLTVFLLWSSAMALRALLRPEDGAWAAPAAWAFAGLAFLSKGLVGLVFPAGWVFWLCVLFPQTRKGFKHFLHPAGPALFLAIVAPWFILMERRHPGFLNFFFTEQHFQRFLTQKYNRSSPWYFFLLVAPTGLLPWTPVVAAGLLKAARDWRSGSDIRGPALALWAGMILVFFSNSQSKLISYILPVFPHLALLGAAVIEEPAAVWLARGSWAIGALLLAAGAVVASLGSRPPWGGLLPPWLVPSASLGVAALGAGLLIYGRSRRGRDVMAMGAAGLVFGLAAAFGLRAAAPLVSAQEISQAIAARWKPGDRVYAYGTYLHGVPFYTGRAFDLAINWVGELHYAKRNPANAARFGDDDHIRALPAPGHKVFIVLRRSEAGHVASLGQPGKAQVTYFGNWALADY